MAGDNSRHNSMPAPPSIRSRTHHFYLPENFFRMVSSVKFRNLLMELNEMPRFDVLCQETDALWYKAESPTPAVPSRTAANLLRTTLTNIVSTCMPPRKPRVFYDVVVSCVFPGFRFFRGRQTVFYFLCLTHNIGDKDTAFPFIFRTFV